MMRKRHTKSRFGCQQCKQRKVKCDETKPACHKCASARRTCSYLASLPAVSTPPSTHHTNVLSPPQPDHIYSDVPTSYIHGASHVSPIVDDAQRVLQDSPFVAERYSILHLELLDHLRSRLFDLAPSVKPGSVDRVLQLAYGEGLRVPFLMDQLLALAAAHKSTTVTGTSRHLYRTESARLQTRALAQASLDEHVVTRDNSLALFAFSSVLGQHVLFDVFSSAADLPTMLDKLVQCFDLHQGIRVTAGKAWEKLQPMLHDDSLSDQGYMAANADVTATGTECNELLDHLEHSGLDRDTINEYKETVRILQYFFDSAHSSHCRIAIAVHEWPVRVSRRYITLLRQRRPEALIVLAYYAVLLYYARDYWAVGGSGAFLIRSITSHLGDYWANWLTWPKQEIEQVQRPA